MSFQAPIGTAEERSLGKIWPGGWIDATPYLTRYFAGVHTGADLNLNLPGAWDKDAHSPVYAMADGIVTYAQKWPNPKYWGNIIVIDHGIVDGKPLFSRYAHVENVKVFVGQPVRIGDQVASVGNGDGLFAYHLHFDISTTDILRLQPQNWPAPKANPDLGLVKDHYVDPKTWLTNHFGAGAEAKIDPMITPNVVLPDPSNIITLNQPPQVVIGEPATGMEWFVIAADGLFIRDQPSTSGSKRASVVFGARVSLEARMISQDSYNWGQISMGPNRGLWIAMGKVDQSQIFMSTNPPMG